MIKRCSTRTWHSESVPSQPVAQVQDPALRYLLVIARRARLAVAAALVGGGR